MILSHCTAVRSVHDSFIISLLCPVAYISVLRTVEFCIMIYISSFQEGIMTLFNVLLGNLWGFDTLIIIAALFNGFWIYRECGRNADKVYHHFNRKDYTANLTQEQKEAFQAGSEKETVLTPQDLLKYREKTNQLYALYTNFTSVFPLLGMFGTVISLIRMGDLIGTGVQGAFFSALTSTFWGIVAAIVFKLLDSGISYKIEDNEKHLEYLFNPNKEGRS